MFNVLSQIIVIRYIFDESSQKKCIYILSLFSYLIMFVNYIYKPLIFKIYRMIIFSLYSVCINVY